MKALKELREKSGLTQSELAKALSVNRSSIAKWENYDVYPHAKIISKISEILECSTDDLLRP